MRSKFLQAIYYMDHTSLKKGTLAYDEARSTSTWQNI